MSGIVGIINLDGAPVDRRLLQQMTDFMAYRGPDAQEIWVNGSIGFGHTMLRTTYESERERQPCTLDGQVWITADARIDGRKELTQKLEAKGRTGVASATDVELILNAYNVWGEDCVHHLLGDFSFAIWDGEKGKLFSARDHFGVKLFYYAKVGNSFIFGNTLNCIRKHPAVSAKLNDLAIGDFLLFGYNPELTTTTFSDIQRIPPAHRLTLSSGEISLERYWRLPTDSEIIRYQRDYDYIDHFKELLGYSVGDRLRTDKVSIFMSGGLDSPTLAATVCEQREKQSLPIDLKAYCCVYDRSPDEERYYSQLVADALKIPLQHILVDDYKMFERWDLPELQRPEPYDDPLIAIGHDLLRAGMKHSRVVLYGEDGDAALFPASIVDMLKGMPFGQVVRDVGRYIVSHRRRPLIGLGILKKFKAWKDKQHGDDDYPPWLNDDFTDRLSLRRRWTDLKDPEPAEKHLVRPEARRRLTSPFWQPFLESLEPGITLMPVEYRLPLLDVRLIEYLFRIPPLPWCVNKQLLRTAMHGVLPELVLTRPKSPLSFDPYQVRMRNYEAAWIDAFKASRVLSRYVNRKLVPEVAGEHYDWQSSWRHLRPLILNHWLDFGALGLH